MSNLHLWHRTEIGKLKKDMDDLFDSLVRDFCSPANPCSLRHEMDVHVVSTEDAFVVTVCIQNLDPETLEISVSENILRIFAQRLETIRGVDGLGISRQQFAQSVSLVSPVRVDQVSARYSNGMLRILLPKATGTVPVIIRAAEHKLKGGIHE